MSCNIDRTVSMAITILALAHLLMTPHVIVVMYSLFIGSRAVGALEEAIHVIFFSVPWFLRRIETLSHPLGVAQFSYTGITQGLIIGLPPPTHTHKQIWRRFEISMNKCMEVSKEK